VHDARLGEACSSTASLTRSSTSSTVAARMARAALMVSNSGSPGPAPTSVTVPGWNWVVDVVTVAGMFMVG
jgi:hypothetical protein